MAKRGHRRNERAIKVQYTEVGTGKSISYTVYPNASRLSEVALHGQEHHDRRWSTTKINDKRHKRR